MKKLLGVILAVFFCSNVFSQGIEFEHGTFAEALAKAKKENKMVFMDCYTTWCGPCKQLAKKVFPQKEVGDYFNTHFVNVKMDMEKGEGAELAKKYGVKTYPTLLFMDAAGKVLHTKLGSSGSTGLIEVAKVARDPSRRIGTFKEKYAKGNRDPKLVAQYVRALMATRCYKREEMLSIGKDFIANCPKEKLVNIDAFTVITYSGTLEFGSETYKYITANKDKFIAVEGIKQENYDAVVVAAVYKYVSDIAKTGSLDELKSAIKAVKKDLTTSRQKLMEHEWYSIYYWVHKEYENWFDRQILYAKKTLSTDKERGENILLNAIYRVIADDLAFKDTGVYGKVITEAENYLKDGGKSLVAYYYLASLYKKNGNKAKALENINTFIVNKKAEGDKINYHVDRLKAAIEKM